MIDSIASKASAYRGRPILARHVELVLAAMLRTSDPREIVRYSGVPLVYVADILKALKELGYAEFDRGAMLTEAGRKLVGELGIRPLDFSCRSCDGRGIVPPMDRLEAYLEVSRDRPEPKHERDQGYVTPVTAVSRVALMATRGDLAGKDVLIIGDDDLMSLAIAITGLARRIVVIDADERIIGFIKRRAAEYGFDVEAEVFDVRKPFPEERHEAFDTFNTDPTETIPAIKAFVGRGVRALKLGGAGYFGITRVESSLYKRREHQRILLDLGCVITDLIRDFNHYENRGYYAETRGREALPIKVPPRRIRYTSTLYRIEKVAPGGHNEPIELGEEFYIDDEVATV